MEQNVIDITNFIFFNIPPKQACLTIVPGTFRTSIVKKVVELYKKNRCTNIITTGAPENEQGLTEAQFQKRLLIKNGVPEKNIFTDNQSTNTKENAEYAQHVAEKHQLDTTNILIPAKNYHCRRAYMTFKKVFRKSNLYISPVVDDRNITRHNWYKTRKKREKVMQEIQKIGKYYLKRDLSL